MGRTSASAGLASWSQMQGSYRGLSQLILRFGFSGLPEKNHHVVRDSTEALEHVCIYLGVGWGLWVVCTGGVLSVRGGRSACRSGAAVSSGPPPAQPSAAADRPPTLTTTPHASVETHEHTYTRG